MSGTENFADTVATWAQHEPSIKALVFFGSQVRAIDDQIGGADARSDWDFEIISSQPQIFHNASWVSRMTDVKVRAFAVRAPRLGALPKINLVLGELEADFVIIPSRVARLARLAVRFGLHRHNARVRSRLQDLAIVLRPGFRILKGAKEWGDFFGRVVAEVDDPRLDSAAVLNIAEGFVCDYVSASRKLERGELLNVQRVLHRDLTETNFRLMHELKLRRGERSFPDARRLERVTTPSELSDLSVRALPDAIALRAAMERSATTLRELVQALLGDAWRWPDV